MDSRQNTCFRCPEGKKHGMAGKNISEYLRSSREVQKGPLIAPAFIFKQLQSCILRKCFSFPTEFSSPMVTRDPGTCRRTRTVFLRKPSAHHSGGIIFSAFFNACTLRNQAIRLVKLNPNRI